MQQDKKSLGGRHRLILLPRLGQAEVVSDLDPRRLKRFVTRFVKQAGSMSQIEEG
jgi:3-dehydroquinate synthetase